MAPRTTILLVDDEPDARELTATYLERVDPSLRTVTAPNAEGALDRLEAEPVECVVSDYDMPDTDGLSLFEQVRERHPDLPFVLFTGKGSEEIASEAVSAGVTDYLQKSTGSDQYEVLANRVTNAVDRADAERRAAGLGRINDLIRVVQGELVRAETPEEIRRRVCESLTGADPYRFAWVGVPDGDVIEPVAMAGDGVGYLDGLEIRCDDTPEGTGPAGEAIRTREPQVLRRTTEQFEVDAWRRSATEYGFESVIALPLTDEGRLHGVLPLYADRPDAFDGEERTVLCELADTVAKALTAAENRRRIEQYETVVNAVGDPMYACDARGRFGFVNRAFEALTGYDRGTLAGSALSRVFPDGELERIEAAVPDHGATDDCGPFELDVVRADGETVPCEVHLGVLPGESRDGGTAGVVRDISDRRADERARGRLYELATDPDRDFEETCRGLLDLGRDRLDVENGALIAVEGDRHETVFSTDRTAEGATVPADRTYCRRVLAEERLVALHNAGEQGFDEDPAYDEYGYECYIGTEVVADGESYGSVCFTDPNARRRSFSESDRSFVELVARVVGYEIERRRARERLEGHEETLRRLHRVASAPDREYDERITDVLALGRDVLGARYGVLSHVNGDRYELASLAAPDGYDDFERGAVLDISETACERTVENRETVSVASMDGDPYWADKPIHTDVGISCYIGAPVFVEDDLYGTLCFHHTEPRETAFTAWEETLVELLGQWVSYTLSQQRTETALSRERDRLDEFAGALSHDLRTPLSIAIGRVDVAAADCECGRAADSLDAAADALDRMGELVDDTLALAREGRTVGETEPTDLGATAEAAWSNLDASGATLRVADDLPTVEADPGRLRRLLDNVFANAVEHAATDGGVTVTVSPADSDGAGVAFAVADDGTGIPAEERERVRERGYSTATDGTGFGLSIVERIATAHGWTIHVEESVSGGVSLRFTGVDTAE